MVGRALVAAATGAGEPSPPIRVTIAAANIEPLAGAVGPASRLRRRYADVPAAARLPVALAGERFAPRSARTPLFTFGKPAELQSTAGSFVKLGLQAAGSRILLARKAASQ
jgi:hypothetical protein